MREDEPHPVGALATLSNLGEGDKVGGGVVLGAEEAGEVVRVCRCRRRGHWCWSWWMDGGAEVGEGSDCVAARHGIVSYKWFCGVWLEVGEEVVMTTRVSWLMRDVGHGG